MSTTRSAKYDFLFTYMLDVPKKVNGLMVQIMNGDSKGSTIGGTIVTIGVGHYRNPTPPPIPL